MANLLAVVNAAQLRHPIRDARMAGFVDGIDAINRLVEASPGFVWRGRGVVGHSALLPRARGVMLVNLSLWETYRDFHAFTYRGAHGRYLSARSQWFVSISGPTTALWWIDAESGPIDLDEALTRLRIVRRDGPSPRAFTVLTQWDAEGRPVRRQRRGNSLIGPRSALAALP